MHPTAIAGFLVAGESKVIFHVSSKAVQSKHLAFKLSEDVAVGLAKNVGQHIEPSAVRHANDKFLHPQFRATLDDSVQRRDDGFTAFQRKAFLAHELGLEEVFKRDRLVDLAEHLKSLVRSQIRGVAAFLHAPL